MHPTKDTTSHVCVILLVLVPEAIGNRSFFPALLEMNDWLRYSLKRDGQEELSFFLTLNYRGHVSFLMVPSALFYADRLQRAGYDGRQAGQKEEEESGWCQKLRTIELLAGPVF